MAPGDGVDERHLFPLTGVRIGLWKPRSAWSSFMLMLPASRKFVVLLIRHGSSKVRTGNGAHSNGAHSSHPPLAAETQTGA